MPSYCTRDMEAASQSTRAFIRSASTEPLLESLVSPMIRFICHATLVHIAVEQDFYPFCSSDHSMLL